MTAIAAMVLAENCVIRLDDPIDDLLPELADRRVMVDAEESIDETVPAGSPITVHDLLTFRLGHGHGMDFTAFGRQPLLGAIAALGPARRPKPARRR